MPDVSTITARLRAGAWVAGRLNPKAAAVTLDVAEAAVEEAYRAGEEARGPAASPDERLREALAFYADAQNYVGGEVGWWANTPDGEHRWCMDFGAIARAALAAADREALNGGTEA